MRKIMIFNLKYLILPLSIMVCINNNCINAMEDINENQNKIIENNTKFQNEMSVNEMGQVMSSVINHEQLNNVQIDFIQRLAYAVSSELPQDIKKWGQNIYKSACGDAWTFLGEVEDVNEGFFNNLTILSFISQYDIHRNTNAVENEIGKIGNHNCSTQSHCWLGDCNECNQNYIYFLKQIEKCYKQYHINKTQYIALLKFLLYYNTNRLFKIIINNNYKYDETILDNLKGKGKINLSTSPHPILDCMTPYINYGYYHCNSIENIISPITKIMEQLIEILLPSKITLVDINKLKEKIKTSVLELMAQGIYDATRRFNYESKQFEIKKQEYAKIFDINSKEFLKKIDIDFNITVLILTLQTKKLLDEQKDPVQLNKMIKDLLNDYISRSINENNVGNIIDELNTGKIVDPKMFSEDQDEDKSFEYKPTIKVVIKKAIKELISNFIQNEETKILSEITSFNREKKLSLINNRRKKYFMSLINLVKQMVVNNLVKNNYIVKNPERYNPSPSEYIIKQTGKDFEIYNLPLAKKFGILECFKELIEEDTRNGTNNIPDEWKEVYSDFIASGGYL